jgi:hypothetical protein
MTIDPSKSSTPFASINRISQFEHEDEVLFSMHTVFRIDGIEPMTEDKRLFHVELTLTSDNNDDLRFVDLQITYEEKLSQTHQKNGFDYVQFL